ncbi:SAM-dependent methyltransferase [Gammaproteobacteria bacterium 53_120_T64]|nr:SAM-dependent methyltransferase [Gammaproteobacteria bacterium 53_120_T64]
MDGFDSYAPDFAHDGGGFRPHYFSELARLEETNFWFKIRNQLLMWAIEKYCPNFQSLLEIGCGTGYVLSGISKRFPHTMLCGSEIFIAGLGFAATRLPSSKFMQMDARSIPFENEFDVIGAFDVLEHIKEDEEVLTQMYTALKPEGLMLLTIPQHAWLWSAIDEYACHERRYAAADLHNKIDAAGFRVIRSTSFVTTLLPAMMVSRFLQKKVSDKQFDASAELKISPWLNSLFFRVLNAELALIKRGFDLPVGGSRLVVARRI